MAEKAEDHGTRPTKREKSQVMNIRERPSQERAQEIVRAHEEQLAERLRELQDELPRSDREMSSIRITI